MRIEHRANRVSAIAPLAKPRAPSPRPSPEGRGRKQLTPPGPSRAILPLPPGEGWGEGICESNIAPIAYRRSRHLLSPVPPHPDPLPEGEGERAQPPPCPALAYRGREKTSHAIALQPQALFP